MYSNQPVMIPKHKKIYLRKMGESVYVQYEVGRKYNPEKKYNVPERKEIGIQIPEKPEMMLPNENYFAYFEEDSAEAVQRRIQEYAEKRDRERMLRDFFEQLYYEFQFISRRMPSKKVNRNKAERLNSVLKPLMEMMKGKPYAKFLGLIEAGEDEHERGDGDHSSEQESGGGSRGGMTYSDAALLMTQYKGALNRYFLNKI